MEEWSNEYSDSVRGFLEEADWISALERPLAVQLEAMARSLDKSMREEGSVVPAAASQFAMTWARLAKRDPANGKPAGDQLDGWLQPIPGLEAGLAHGSGCRCEACAA